MRMRAVFLVVAIVAMSAGANAGEPFTVRIAASPVRLSLGVPADLLVEVENGSGAAVSVAFNRPPLAVLIDSEAGSETYCPFCRGRWGVVRRLLPEGWQHEESLQVPLKTVGIYSLRVVLKHHWNISEKPDEYPDLWWSQCVSEPTAIDVLAPEGIDKEAYEAFGRNPLGDSERFGELLRRFPTSTYAAYAIWKRWGKFSSPEWNTSEDREATLSWLAKNPDEEYLTWRMPCTEDGEPDASVETRFEARLALTCRDHWLSAVLRNHPEIWFGDEIRYRLAIDRYRLGQRESGIADLQNLAENGKPYIASTAAELLSAMKAKGMLEEKEK